MFKNSYQSGLLSIFYSCGSHPLALWQMEVNNGHIKRLTDNEVNSIVLEIVSTNVATTYITCPPNKQYLGIKLPFLVMIVKNLKRYFTFEITILDDKNMRRRFRISNFQSTTKIKPFCTTMPIGLSGGWNQIQFNLSDFTRRAYGSQYIEALRVQVHANVRLRRIYFAERLYTEEELPQDYKLYLPLEKKSKRGKDKKVPEAAVPVGEAMVAPKTQLEKSAETKVSLTERKSTVEPRKSMAGKKSIVAVPRKSTIAPTPLADEEKPSELDESEAADDATEEAPSEGPTPSELLPEVEGLVEMPTESLAETTAEPLVEPQGETPTEAPAETSEEQPPEVEATPEEVPVAE